MTAGGRAQLCEGDSTAGHRSAVASIDLESPSGQAGEVYDHPIAHIAAAHGAACAAGNERNPVSAGPADQLLQILDVGRQAYGMREDAIDPGGFGIGGPGPHIGSIDAPDSGRRRHRQKLTIFSPYG
jgi:hypothetical protein